MFVPLYLLVVTYTAVQLFLQDTKQFFRVLILFVFLLLSSHSQTVLLRFDKCLSDVQQVRPELLQLTASYTY
jgi:hypothetical protein